MRLTTSFALLLTSGHLALCLTLPFALTVKRDKAGPDGVDSGCGFGHCAAYYKEKREDELAGLAAPEVKREIANVDGIETPGPCECPPRCLCDATEESFSEAKRETELVEVAAPEVCYDEDGIDIPCLPPPPPKNPPNAEEKREDELAEVAPTKVKREGAHVCIPGQICVTEPPSAAKRERESASSCKPGEPCVPYPPAKGKRKEELAKVAAPEAKREEASVDEVELPCAPGICGAPPKDKRTDELAEPEVKREGASVDGAEHACPAGEVCAGNPPP